jgi:hypothetical protein
MPLDRSNWPTRDRIRSDLNARHPLPALPGAFDDWFAFAGSAIGMDIFLDERYSETIGYGAMPLDGLEIVDPTCASAAMEGYRFVLDQRHSSSDDLVWSDQALSGQWHPEWVVVESIQADPFIADISRPGVPILFARHGCGYWSPEPMFESLAEFIASLRAKPRSVPTFEPSPLYTVAITDFGSRPKDILLALKRLPQFMTHSPVALLALSKQSRLVVLEHSVSRSMAERISRILRDNGATVVVTTETPD